MDFLRSVRRAAESVLTTAQFNQSTKIPAAQVWVVGGDDLAFLRKRLIGAVPEWQTRGLAESHAPVIALAGSEHPIWILRPRFWGQEQRSHGHDGRLEASAYGLARDLVGCWWRQNRDLRGDIQFEFLRLKDEEIEGALVGMGIAGYRFLDTTREPRAASGAATRVFMRKEKGAIRKESITRATALTRAMNIARHLTNLPAADLNPVTMGRLATELFAKRAGVKVQVWDEAKLKRENCGLLLGVGAGSRWGARLIHISYRPARGKGKKPLAFVGKGVTFDTGGLDLKSAANMRLMKKDMAGSAIVFGLADFVTEMKLAVPCDFYLAMAENAVSDRSVRPGDILIARNGKAIEIHNTDAEGRLVMADALDVAVTQAGSNAPREVINVATLTGAMRVGLGLDVAGFFANDDKVAAGLEKSARTVGEMIWRMPLVQKYRRNLSSSYADMTNCSDSSYGGSITAALFLESFVRNVPWAHFDVMAWNMAADGPFQDGGNAQALQTLAKYVESKR